MGYGEEKAYLEAQIRLNATRAVFDNATSHTYMDPIGEIYDKRTNQKVGYMDSMGYFQSTSTSHYAEALPLPAMRSEDVMPAYEATPSVSCAAVANDGSLARLNGHNGCVNCIQIIGGKIASSGNDKTIRVWDLSNFESSDVALTFEESIHQFHWHPNKGVLAVRSSLLGYVSLYDSSSKVLRRKLNVDGHVTGASHYDVDENCLIVGGPNEISKWRADSGECVVRYGYGRVLSLKMTRDRSCLICGDTGGSVSIRDSKNLKVIRWLVRNEAWVNSICISEDDKLVVTADNDLNVRLWNVELGVEIARFKLGRELEVRPHGVPRMAIMPGDQYIAVALNKVIAILNLDTLQLRQSFYVGMHSVTSILALPDGQTFMTGDSNGVIKFWRINVGGRAVA